MHDGNQEQNFDTIWEQNQKTVVEMSEDRDAAWYRHHPSEFFKLPKDEQILRLNEICGEGDFVFKIDPDFPDVEFSEAFRFKHEMEHYNNFVDIDDWNMVAKILYFFGVRRAGFGDFRGFDSLSVFVKHFPFGCFWKRVNESDENAVQYSLGSSWCYGELLRSDIMDTIIYTIDDAVFKMVLKQLSVMMFYRTTLLKVCEYFNSRYIDVNPPANIRKQRAWLILDVLSQLPSRPSGDHSDEVVFPCMMNGYYNQEQDFPKFPCMKRPMWTKERHLALADERFKKMTMTVMLMQKFRWSNFPVVRDLLVMIIGFAFDAHVIWLGEELVKRRQTLRDWENNHFFEEKYGRALDLGIIFSSAFYPSGYNVHNVSTDIHDLLQGKMLPTKRMIAYRKSLACAMIFEAATLKARISPKLKSVYMNLPPVKFAERLLDWTELRGKKISSIYNKMGILTNQEIQDFVVYLERLPVVYLFQ